MSVVSLKSAEIAASARAILAKITKGNALAPWRVVVFGMRGVGKSTFASQCPGMLMIPIEEGTNQLRVDQLPQVKSWQELHDTLDALLSEPHEYKAIAIDGVDSMDSLVVTYIDAELKSGRRRATLRNKKEAKSFQDLNEEYGGGYMMVVDEWRRIIAKFDRLRYERGMRIVLVGHAKATRIVNLEGNDFDRWEIQALGRGTTQLICNWADYVLFARREVTTLKMAAPPGSRSKDKIIGQTNGELVIECRGTAAYDAKTRGDIPFPETLPLDWHVFEHTARMIVEHGRLLPAMLREKFESLVVKIKDETRKEEAKSAFEKAVESNHYAFQEMCSDRVQEILLTQDK